MKSRVSLKYFVNECGFFIGWLSFQYGLKIMQHSFLFIPAIWISKCKQTPKKDSILSEGNWTATFWLKRENTHYDEMELLEIRNWKMEILLITTKTDFCSLVFQMLASYIGPEDPKDFRDIITWQIARKLILINSFFKVASFW